MSLITKKCNSCGANVQVDDARSYGFCMYCGTKIVISVESCPKSENTDAASKDAHIVELVDKANGGDVDAMYKLATMYRTGQGAEQDFAEAMKWYKLAADLGDPYAMYNIGMMYSCGLGVKISCVMAERWYGMARDHGLNRVPQKKQ